jgi:hypothetical protein
MDEKPKKNYFQELGRRGGQKRAQNLTPDKRSASARKAAKAGARKRAAQKKQMKKA